jgi:hypothetical protein
MTHRWIATAALVIVSFAPLSALHAQDRGRGEAVDCESRDMGKTRCPVSWDDARMVRQLSDTRCVRGENWGIDRRGLWVDRGCAGRFVEAGGHDRGDERGDRDHHDHGDRDRGGWQPEPGWDSRFNVVCESQDFRYRFCAADLGGGGRASIARQISDSSCVEGRNWGWNRAGVWVDKGCAAEFTIDRRWH